MSRNWQPPTARTIAAGATSRRARSSIPSPIPTRKIASSRNASGLAATVSTANTPKCQRLPAWRAQSASSPSANPSANGNAAEITSPAQTTANVRLDQRATGPYCLPTTTANASAAIPIERMASALIPNTAASG